jgi:putative hydrolase of HD superfamily
MQTKTSNPAVLLEGKSASPLLRAYFESCHLKNLFRQGWLRRGIPRERCESVAEHTFGTALLCMLLADRIPPRLNVEKVLRLALIHDLGEVHAGDLTPADDVGSKEKLARERLSVEKVAAGFPDKSALLEMWDEYAEGSTPEARFVNQVDRLEMAFQAGIYEMQGLGDLSEFLETAREDVSDPAIKGLLAEIEGLR